MDTYMTSPWRNSMHLYDNDRIIQLFTKKVAKNIIESKSGVHIKRLGYFYNHRIPWIIESPDFNTNLGPSTNIFLQQFIYSNYSLY